MTSFKCRECDNHWTEGMTRNHREDQLCRECLKHKLKVVYADTQRAKKEGTDEACRQALLTIHLTTKEAIAELI